jgi:hypothetical protein
VPRLVEPIRLDAEVGIVLGEALEPAARFGDAVGEGAMRRASASPAGSS